MQAYRVFWENGTIVIGQTAETLIIPVVYKIVSMEQGVCPFVTYDPRLTSAVPAKVRWSELAFEFKFHCCHSNGELFIYIC